jgi:starch phosphorylase
MPKPFTTPDEFEKEAVRHIETTLARSLFNCDESAAYAGTALAFRDRLVLDWNKTQQSQTFADQKRIYCETSIEILKEHGLTSTDLSLEFLMGRALDNAMLNVEQKDVASSKLTTPTLPLTSLTHLQLVLRTSVSAWKT